MKLIDKLMRDICAEMEWENYKGLDSCSGSIRARLTARCEAMDAVVEAARELADLMDDIEEGEYDPDSFTTQPIRVALAALKQVRDE